MKTLAEYVNESILGTALLRRPVVEADFILHFIGGKINLDELKNDVIDLTPQQISLLKYCKKNCIGIGGFKDYTGFSPSFYGWKSVFDEMVFRGIDKKEINKIQDNITSMFHDDEYTTYVIWNKNVKIDKIQNLVHEFFKDYLDDFLTYFPGQEKADADSSMW